MARRLRLQYEGAIYHVINRGNYRQDVFASVGACEAFEQVLADCCERHEWLLHAYVLMRNHFHLALATPGANLVQGMHWLEGTYANRFNRFRGERGHLFQGRYHALLVEDRAALVRVVDYIHLNPVRAGVVPAEQANAFRWSSLHQYRTSPRPDFLSRPDWLEELGLDDSAQGWTAYEQHLTALNTDPSEQERLGFDTMSRGWAIGTVGWRKAIACEHEHLALSAGLTGEELTQMKHARWAKALTSALNDAGRTAEELQREAHGASWKIELALRMRRLGASCGWIAQALHMGQPASVRVYLCRSSKRVNM